MKFILRKPLQSNGFFWLFYVIFGCFWLKIRYNYNWWEDIAVITNNITPWFNGNGATRIIKTHGGVKLQKSYEVRIEEQLNEKIQQHAEEKYLIARHAVKKIKSKMYLYLDAGSSTLALIKLLQPADDLVIIINSIFHVELLALGGFNNVYVLGGKYKHQTGALIGWEAITTLQKYQIDCAFLGVNGINGQDLYTTDPDEAMIKAEVNKRATKSYILAD
ncbi:DeoR/GlpR family DNA-binding transcription regulator [Spiroplasma endosymbiont of Ammophila pubescens]|uniref:DeoR/GlpR family DNA-binding transcription regulator n=1 Tax=Spiroplasma endosymbiont of Ammophila pubescens TaxID=3066315 RepID=UPI0032B24FE9